MAIGCESWEIGNDLYKSYMRVCLESVSQPAIATAGVTYSVSLQAIGSEGIFYATPEVSILVDGEVRYSRVEDPGENTVTRTIEIDGLKPGDREICLQTDPYG